MLALVAAVTLLAPPLDDRPPEHLTAIRHVRVFVGDSPAHVLEDSTVLLRGPRIDVVGPAAEVPIAAGVEVVEGRGRTLLPGLVDLHVHLEGSALPFDLRARSDPAQNARAALACGVTAVLDLNGREDVLFPLRAAERSGARPDLPRIFLAGLALTAPAGHGTEGGFPGRVVVDAKSAAAQVDDLAARAPDVVKIVFDGGRWGDFGAFPTLAPEVLDAAVAAAHAQHLKAVVHVVDAAFGKRAIEAGADALAHLPLAGDVDDAFVAAAKAHGTAVIPTLAVAGAMFRTLDDPAYFDVPLVKDCVDPRVVLAFADRERRASLGSSDRVAFFKERWAPALAALKRLHDAGVPLLAGTDCGNPGTCPGDALDRELEAWVEAGIPPADALIAATSAAARFLRGGRDDFGVIAPGKDADLLLVEGNPTTHVEDLRQVVRVWRRGAVVDRSALTAALAEQARRFPLEGAAGPIAAALDFDAEDGALPRHALESDGQGGHGSRIEAIAARDYGKDNPTGFLRLRGEIVVTPPSGGFASIVFPAANSVARGARGLELKLRTDVVRSVTVVVRTDNVLDDDWFRAPITPPLAQARWTVAAVPFARLVQVGFGRRVEFDPARITALEIRIGGDVPGPFVVDVDDVTWMR